MEEIIVFMYRTDAVQSVQCLLYRQALLFNGTKLSPEVAIICLGGIVGEYLSGQMSTGHS